MIFAQLKVPTSDEIQAWSELGQGVIQCILLAIILYCHWRFVVRDCINLGIQIGKQSQDDEGE